MKRDNIFYEAPQGDSHYARTPLDAATRKGYERVRQLLLRFGADYSDRQCVCYRPEEGKE